MLQHYELNAEEFAVIKRMREEKVNPYAALESYVENIKYLLDNTPGTVIVPDYITNDRDLIASLCLSWFKLYKQKSP